MRKRAFCIASLVLVAFALCSDFTAKSQYSASKFLLARSVTATIKQKQQMRAESEQHTNRGGVFGFVGLFFAVSSLICLVISFRRHEPAWWRSIPVALLGVYLMLQFMLV
ncbi:MAG: hypothetical protein WCH99_09535 [Verrucomicrobiota bacterium]